MTFFGHATAQLSQWWATTTATEMIWLGVGFLAQLMFSHALHRAVDRERAGAPLDRAGDVLVFQHGGWGDAVRLAIYRLDPVFMLGQGMGLLIYARNIYFIRAHNRATALAGEGSGGLRPEQPAGRAG